MLGGTGQDTASQDWKERAGRGGVVTKIVSSDEAEITNITRFTNSQNAVRAQDFIALDSSFQAWATDVKNNYNLFLEIQRGGAEARKAYEKQHPDQPKFLDYVNAFDLIKVYGAGWLGAPGLAFSKNAPFLPKGSIYERIVSRQDDEVPFGASDFYAAYILKCAADKIGFGRNADSPSRRQSRFLFYHTVMIMLHNVILLTPELHQPRVSEAVLTEAIHRLGMPESDEAFRILCDAAVEVLNQYLTPGSDHSVHKEEAYNSVHNSDLNAFLKAENLGKENHSPLLVQLLAMHNSTFGISLPGYDDTRRSLVAQAILEQGGIGLKS